MSIVGQLLPSRGFPTGHYPSPEGFRMGLFASVPVPYQSRPFCWWSLGGACFSRPRISVAAKICAGFGWGRRQLLVSARRFRRSSRGAVKKRPGFLD